jgi:hypothetical protein
MLFNRSAATRGLCAVAVLLVPVLAPTGAGATPPAGGSTVRVTTGLGGAPLDGAFDTQDAVVSPDGRFVAFTSAASNLVAGDSNGSEDVFLTDRLFGTTTLISVSSTGSQANDDAEAPSISTDGRFVAFASHATNLVDDDDNANGDVFVRDTVAGTTERVSVDSTGDDTGESSDDPDISANGLIVVFATNGALDPDDDNARQDVYLHNRMSDTTTLVSRTSTGDLSDGSSVRPSVNARGTHVAFESAATDMVPGDTNEVSDVFVTTVASGSVVRASVGQGGNQLDHEARTPDLAHAANVVVYESQNPSGDTGIRRRDLANVGSTPVTPAGVEGFGPSVDASGRRVAYRRSDTRICGGSTPQLYDLDTGTTITPFGGTPTELCTGGAVTISGDGRYLATTTSTVLAPGSPGDTSNEDDVYVRVLADTLFPDVPPANLFFEPVSWMVDAGITTGYPDGTFGPTQVITRQSLAAFLYRYLDVPRASTRATPTFSDVPEDHPFFEEIEWAVQQGFVEGYDDGTFRPTRPVSRQILTAFLHRLTNEVPRAGARDHQFSDVPADHRFHDEIGWAVEHGIVQGFDDGSFRPTDPVSRQAAAAFLFRYDWVGRRDLTPV